MKVTGHDANQQIFQMDAKDQLEAAKAKNAEQVAKALTLKEEQSELNPQAASARTQKKKELSSRGKVKESVKSGDKEQRLAAIKPLDQTLDEFTGQNNELKRNVLQALRDKIKPNDSKEQILKTVLEFYKDPHLIDEALRFLEATTEGELNLRVQELRNELETSPVTVNVDNETVNITPREILAGRNMGRVSREVIQEGFETAVETETSMRGMYRDITDKAQDPNTLFFQLADQYTNIKDLHKVIGFMLHSLGEDMNSQGPSIEHALLMTLWRQTIGLQSILGVYKVFTGLVKLATSLHKKAGIPIPPQFTVQNATKGFMKYISDRFPSSEKVKQLTIALGHEKSIEGKIIILGIMRDAIRKVSPKLYKSTEHSMECYKAIIETSEELEDDLEESQEQDIPDAEPAVKINVTLEQSVLMSKENISSKLSSQEKVSVPPHQIEEDGQGQSAPAA